MIVVTLLGTGSPIPDPNRAGPATLIQAGGEHHLVDAGRGVLMRLAGAGVAVGQLTTLFVTHLHSDHITDLVDVITSRWVMTFEPSPLRIVGPPGTRAVVDHLLGALGPDISYRMHHHEDLPAPPALEVLEVDGTEPGPLSLGGAVTVSVAATDHRPVEPSIGFRFEHDGVAVVCAGDTVPCDGLDRLCAGADAVVHTVIRKDIIANVPVQRMRDTLDYHSSPEQAGETATRAGIGTLVLTHYVPPIPPGGEQDWRDLAATTFAGRVELGDDLHRIEIRRPNREDR